MIKYKKKIIITIFVVILCTCVGKIIIAGNYVGDIVVSYPWEEYTIWEKMAHDIKGLPKHFTKQELYDRGLIKDMNGPFRKFNKSHYK